MITGAIFDMDGVLIDSMPVWENIDGIYLKGQGKEPEPGLTEILFTKSMQEAAEYLRQAYGLPKTAVQIAEEIIDLVRLCYREEIPAKAGALPFVRGLRDAGVHITVATASDRELAEAALLRLGILEYVEGIFTCKDAGAGKEASPAVYLDALGSMGTEMAGTWVFEDVLHGIRTANRAGFQTAGVYDASSEAYQELIQKEASVYLRDLTDFNGFYQSVAALGGYTI